MNREVDITGKKFVMIHGKSKVRLSIISFSIIYLTLFLAQLIFNPPLIILAGTGLLLCLHIVFGTYIFLGTERKLVLANLYIGLSLGILAIGLLTILIYNSLKVSYWLVLLLILITLFAFIGTLAFVYKKEYLNNKNSIKGGYKGVGLGVFIGSILGRNIMKNLAPSTQFRFFIVVCIFGLFLSLFGAIFYSHRYYRLSRRYSWRYQIIYDEEV